MVVRNNLPLLQKEPEDQIPRHGDLIASLSPVGLKSPSLPLIPRLSKQTSIRRNYSTTTTVTVAGPAYSTLSVARSADSALSLPSTMAQKDKAKPLDVESDVTTQEFQGDIKVSTSVPSKSTLEKVADLPVFDVDGKTIPFKSLYWPDTNERKKVMIIFIRHFFCGVCIASCHRRWL